MLHPMDIDGISVQITELQQEIQNNIQIIRNEQNKLMATRVGEFGEIIIAADHLPDTPPVLPLKEKERLFFNDDLKTRKPSELLPVEQFLLNYNKNLYIIKTNLIKGLAILNELSLTCKSKVAIDQSSQRQDIRGNRSILLSRDSLRLGVGISENFYEIRESVRNDLERLSDCQRKFDYFFRPKVKKTY